MSLIFVSWLVFRKDELEPLQTNLDQLFSLKIVLQPVITLHLTIWSDFSVASLQHVKFLAQLLTRVWAP